MQLQVKYDKKEISEDILYNKIIEKTIDDTLIKIQGYMPQDAYIFVEHANLEEVSKASEEYMNENTTLNIAYNIKIISNEKEYNPEHFDENVKVTISEITNFNETQKYKVLHITEENTVEEIKEVEVTENELLFEAQKFSVYAILSEDIEETEPILLEANPLLRAAVLSSTASVWDGSSASDEFKYGSGTLASPYFITSAEDLVYLRNQVNAGNTFSGQYIELLVDIDLNNNAWTPIGDNDSSFRGTFDGGGHVISNATITTPTASPTSKQAFGFFGSIGGGNSRAIIKNIKFDSINIVLSYNANLQSTSGGVHVGIVSGKMYRLSTIANVIANNCTITSSSNPRIRTADFQFFVGGLVGLATNTTNSETDPGSNNRYSIENCFSNVNITLNYRLRNDQRSYAGQYAVGGIIGAIRSQPVWPTNCLYTGSINSTYSFTGPIFGYLRGNADYTTTNFPTLWYGENSGTLTMTSYYSNYSTNGKSFTSTHTTGNTPTGNQYRVSNTSTNIGYTQGMNKGTHMPNISSMIGNFNTFSSNNGYISWEYQNGTYSFLPRMNVSLDDSNEPQYTVSATSNYIQQPTFTYKWYINGVENTSLGSNVNTITQQPSLYTDYDYVVIISDGTYYGMVHFVVQKLELYLEYNINQQNNSVTANFAGSGIGHVDLSEYTYKWYKTDLSGMDYIEINNANTLTLTNLEAEMEYKLIATNTANSALSREISFTYLPNRTVIYVRFNGGNNNNNGLTPATALKNMSNAYVKLDSSKQTNQNIIVIIGDYTGTDYLNNATATTYAKRATITSCYQGVDYSGRLLISGDKFITADTAFQYISLIGSATGTGQAFMYVQGNDLTMGEQVYMQNYATSGRDTYALASGTAPDFHIVGAYLNYNQQTLNNNGNIIIKSGTYARIIAGTRNTRRKSKFS